MARLSLISGFQNLSTGLYQSRLSSVNVGRWPPEILARTTSTPEFPALQFAISPTSCTEKCNDKGKNLLSFRSCNLALRLPFILLAGLPLGGLQWPTLSLSS
jgi:hypothetical protein